MAVWGARRRSVGALVTASVIVAIAGVPAGRLPAQQVDGLAFLLSAPQYERGISALPGNAIPHLRARWEVADTFATAFVTAPPELWAAGIAEPTGLAWVPACGRDDTAIVALRGASEVLRIDRERSRIYLEVPAGAAWACRFTAALVRDFEFFLEANPDSITGLFHWLESPLDPPPLRAPEVPAVIETGP